MATKPKQTTKAAKTNTTLKSIPRENARALATPQSNQRTAVANSKLGAPKQGAPAYVAYRDSNSPNLTNSEKKKILKRENGMVKVDVKGETKILYEVPHCTRHYVSARIDPFNSPAGACLPCADFSQPSAKFKTICSGALQLGTTGFGFVAFLPAWGVNSNNVSSTTSASVGGINTNFGSFTNLITSSFTELPYPAASFGSDLEGRFVAGGIRIRYTGKYADQNGLIVAYCDLDHSSVTNAQSFQTIANLRNTRRIVVTGTVFAAGKDLWNAQVCDNGPVLSSEYSYAAASSVQSTPYMILAIQGIAGDSYEFEVVQHCEIIGRAVANLTASHTDPVGFPAVDQKMKGAFDAGPPQKAESPGILTRIKEGIFDVLPKLITHGKVIGPVVQGIMSLVPNGGHYPMVQNGPSGPELLTHDAVIQQQKRIDQNLGRGSNLRLTPEAFMRKVAISMMNEGIEPETLAEYLTGELEGFEPIKKVLNQPLISTTPSWSSDSCNVHRTIDGISLPADFLDPEKLQKEIDDEVAAQKSFHSLKSEEEQIRIEEAHLFEEKLRTGRVPYDELMRRIKINKEAALADEKQRYDFLRQEWENEKAARAEKRKLERKLTV